MCLDSLARCLSPCFRSLLAAAHLDRFSRMTLEGLLIAVAKDLAAGVTHTVRPKACDGISPALQLLGLTARLASLSLRLSDNSVVLTDLRRELLDSGMHLCKLCRKARPLGQLVRELLLPPKYILMCDEKIVVGECYGHFSRLFNRRLSFSESVRRSLRCLQPLLGESHPVNCRCFGRRKLLDHLLILCDLLLPALERIRLRQRRLQLPCQRLDFLLLRLSRFNGSISFCRATNVPQKASAVRRSNSMTFCVTAEAPLAIESAAPLN